MDKYVVILGKEGSMKGYKSMVSREFDYADLGIGDGIQVSRDCDKEYENELKRRINIILDSFNLLDELKDQYGFMNPPQSIERNISTLGDKCLAEINSVMEVSHFDTIEELAETFNHLFSNVPSNIKDYINASRILESKGINIRNL